MDQEIAFVLKRFGDEQSTLLDQFERLSFEVQLNQAILGRSFSEPGGVGRSRFLAPPRSVMESPLVTEVRQGKRRRGLGLHKVLKKILEPIFGRKGKIRRGGGGVVAAAKRGTIDSRLEEPRYWKAFSRSLRV